MPKYKISKENINEFFGLFGKKRRQDKINQLIDNDPVLKKLDREIEKINKSALDRIKSDPEKIEMFRRIGIDVLEL